MNFFFRNNLGPRTLFPLLEYRSEGKGSWEPGCLRKTWVANIEERFDQLTRKLGETPEEVIFEPGSIIDHAKLSCFFLLK